VLLDRPLSGAPDPDAASVLAAIRAGRMFTAVDALAAPAVLDFRSTRDATMARMGDVVPPGPAALDVSTTAPAGARTVLLLNGKEVSAVDGGALHVEVPSARGAYRVEVQVPNAPGRPPIPWVVSNPIYFLEPQAQQAAAKSPEPVLLEPSIAWHVEKDRGSSGSVVASSSEVAFYYRLRGPGRGSQFVAAVADLQRRAPASAAITFRAQTVRPSRVSIQLRYNGGGGLRWRRSVYLDSTPRDIAVPISELLPADRQTGPAPPATTATSLLFVVDLTNALPGAANTIRISRVGFAPMP
jgi:hypothetical protein